MLHLNHCFKVSCLGLAATMVLATQANAAIRTWDGSDSTDYATGANWVGGVAPEDSDFKDDAVFTENSPGNKTPNLAASRKVNRIKFDNSVGWDFTGSQMTLKYLESSGTGTNIINSVKSAQNNYDWVVGVGNILNIKTFYQDGGGRKITLTGGGTLLLNNQIDGYSSTNDFYLTASTMRVAKTTAYGNAGGQTHLNDAAAALELKTTVLDATSQIGTKIIDETGLGLGVTDIGGGYVRIAVVPEPAGMLALAGAGLLALKRRRTSAI